VVEDYGRFDSGWFDTRGSSDNLAYHMYFSIFTADKVTGVLGSAIESPAWSGINGTYSATAWYGDMNYHVNGRDHAHLLNPLTVAGSCPLTQTVSCAQPVTATRSSFSLP
jgi:hypothetical protein